MKANRKGFTLVELLVVIGILGILMGALFPAISAAMLKANLSSAGMRGRNLYVSITSANTGRQSIGLSTVWPRTKSANESTGGDPDIADMTFNSAYEYFNELFDMEHKQNADQWQPYVDVDVSVLSGSGVNPVPGGQILKADNVGWTIGANIQDELMDVIPVIVSRNVNSGELKKKYEGSDNSSIGLGTIGGSQYNTPFSNKGFVMIRKGGSVISTEGRYCRFQQVYDKQAFEIPEAGDDMDDFCYLTPEGRTNPQ